MIYKGHGWWSLANGYKVVVKGRGGLAVFHFFLVPLQQMNKLPKYIDWGFCLVMVPLMTFIFPLGRWVNDRPSYAVLLVGILYLNYFVNRRFSVPLFFQGYRGIIGTLLIFAGFVACIGVLTYYHEGWPFYRLAKIYSQVDLGKVQMSQQRIWLAFLTVHLFSVTVGLVEMVGFQRIRQQAIQHERDLAALALYRAQLNPHFLYNTLNSLYGLIVTRSEQAEPAFVKFTELARTITANIDKDSIPVDKSQEFLRNFIDLQKLRMRPETNVSFTYESDDSTARIAPMILFTFVENALKHGTADGLTGDIIFQLRVSAGLLSFRAENPMAPIAHPASCGTGLTNCCKRLALLYPNRYQLNISHGNGRYLVDLTIKLTEPT